MRGRLVFDLETVSLPEADAFMEPTSAPSNYKDPDKIAAYCAEERKKQLGKCALDPDLCGIVAIGYQTEDGPVTVATLADADEASLVRAAWTAIGRSSGIVGFNMLGFDLPVLIRRSQYLGVDPMEPVILDRYRTPHVDLMERLSFNGKLRYRSLDFYCKRFGIDVPDAHNGKDIDALVKALDWPAVAAHCRADVEKTRRLAARLGEWKAVEEAAEVF